ncbi:MAG: RagB/SusD family nutrient uptake outer membrane protein [Paenibacillus sp.]|nr:RagB/SusD family nutrient uptake outer membrane protein [Paenibacillus sp.]
MILKIFNRMTVMAVASAMALGSCESYTDIDQKGMNLLTKTSDLELLLNTQYSGPIDDLGTVSGDIISRSDCGYLPQTLTNSVKTYGSILISWDEEAHASRLPQLTEQDGLYEACYNYIGRIANPILQRVDDADGTQDHKDRLRAEAYAMRAFFHFIVAQKYAKAYDPSVASSEPCIPYMTEDCDIQQPTSQATQKEVYELILRDLDRAIELNSLPESAINRMRFCAAMPYAIKAHVLLVMRDLDGAEIAAKEALKHGDMIDDYADYIATGYSYGGFPIESFTPGTSLNLEEDYFASAEQNIFKLITPFCESMFEDGSYRKDNLVTNALRYRGAYDPDDLDNDLLIIKANNEKSYGVPYIMTYDMRSYHNTIGIKTTHMYLILAECAIGRGDIGSAMEYLDMIRVKRIAPSHYQDLKGRVQDKAEAIRCLKKTCHGEYAYTIWNFFCRKRWTKLDDYKETFTRVLCGNTYTLTPESDLWVFPFPVSVMALNPNLKHNYDTK